MHKDLRKETRNGRLEGGLPQHFASLAKHVAGNAVLLRTSTYNVVTLSFGMDTALTSATNWVFGRSAPWPSSGFNLRHL